MPPNDPESIPAIHPGVFVLEDVLKPLHLDVRTAADTMGLEFSYLVDLISMRASVTDQAAQALGKLAGNGPELWHGLQAFYDRWNRSGPGGSNPSPLPLQAR